MANPLLDMHTMRRETRVWKCKYIFYKGKIAYTQAWEPIAANTSTIEGNETIQMMYTREGARGGLLITKAQGLVQLIMSGNDKVKELMLGKVIEY